MRFEKKVIGTLSKCYSIAPLPGKQGFRFLVAAEKRDPCYLFDADGALLETVWQQPGGAMTLVQVPGQEHQFLATHQFYSPNDSLEAKIVVTTRISEHNWQSRTLVDVPFVHRFGLLERGGVCYLLVCCLKSGHTHKDDWSSPGCTYYAELPRDLSSFHESHQLELTLLKDDMCHNHGFCTYLDNGVQTALVTCDSGVYQFVPPAERGGRWSIRRLYEQPVSDAVLCDFDGDGLPELGCISPFHGDQLYICHLNSSGSYEKVWTLQAPAEMLHATWPCTLAGKAAWLAGWRKGSRDLIAITFENGAYHVTYIDHDCGPANVMKFDRADGTECIVAANRETDEIALYHVLP